MMVLKDLECEMEEFLHVKQKSQVLEAKINQMHKEKLQCVCFGSYQREESSMFSHPQNVWKQQKQRVAVRVKQQTEPKWLNSSSLSFVKNLTENIREKVQSLLEMVCRMKLETRVL